MSEGFAIDHVIYGVQDVDAAAERLRREHGLGSVPGGAHRGGTTNRIVPLEPPAYLELLGIGDPTLPDGAWLRQTLAGRDRPLWWVLTVDDLDESAARRRLPVQSGLMTMADGSELTFRTAGMPRYPLPFFVDYDVSRDERAAAMRQRLAAAAPDCEPGPFTRIEVGGDPAVLAAWLGDHELPVRHVAGDTPAIVRAALTTDRGEIVVEDTPAA